MAKAGDTIDNPITGERVIFLQTGKETEGQLLQIDLSVRPGGFVAAEHVHPLQQERFLIKSGHITLRIDGNVQQCMAGDEVTIPAGTPHVWWNSGQEELRVVVELWLYASVIEAGSIGTGDPVELVPDSASRGLAK